MHAYEKGIIWGNDNYLIQSALVDLVLATHNVGRRGTGCVRMGGHQEGYTRPPYPGNTKIFIDEELMKGKGKMLTAWGCNNFQTTLNAQAYRTEIHRRANIVKEAMAKARGATTAQMVDVIVDACDKGGLFVTTIDLYPVMFSEASHLLLPAAHPGEMNLTSMNGERRIRLSQKFMDPPGTAKPDCLIAAAIANKLKAMYQADGNATMAARFDGFEWKNEEDAFNDGFRRAGQTGVSAHRQPGRRHRQHRHLRAPARRWATTACSCRSRSTRTASWSAPRCSTPTTSSTRATARRNSCRRHGPALPKPVADQKAKHQFWINNGRINEVWQTGYHNKYNAYVRGRYPMSIIEMNPQDMAALKVEGGDIVEVYNDWGSTFAMAYPEPDQKAWSDLHAVRLRQRRAGRRDDQLDRPQHHSLLQGHVGEHPARRAAARSTARPSASRAAATTAFSSQRAAPPPRYVDRGARPDALFFGFPAQCESSQQRVADACIGEAFHACRRGTEDAAIASQRA